MAAVTMQTTLAPKTAFLGSVAGRLSRTSASVVLSGPVSRSLKVEAKGNWLPGSTSPKWLDGRYGESDHHSPRSARFPFA